MFTSFIYLIPDTVINGKHIMCITDVSESSDIKFSLFFIFKYNISHTLIVTDTNLAKLRT